MTLRDRLGIDLGGRTPIEESLAWAGQHGVRYVDASLEGGTAPNVPHLLTDTRVAEIRRLCERHDIRLGLHTLSAVNVAETAPFVSEAVDAYLRGYIELAPRLGAAWIVVHGGFHFSSDYESRRAASLARLARAAEQAERAGVQLLLENLNREPEHAEVHYLAFSLEECRDYFGRLVSPRLGWAFTVNHAHLVPEGIDGFLDGLDVRRCGEVRLADNHGGHELHLRPGEGTIDFARLFRRLEQGGYRGHYMLAFGSRDDMAAGRDTLARLAGEP
jgi:sugar phosphate isomerase/epimerase